MVFCTGLSLLITSVVVGLAIVILIIIARYPSGITIRKFFGKKSFITFKS